MARGRRRHGEHYWANVGLLALGVLVAAIVAAAAGKGAPPVEAAGTSPGYTPPPQTTAPPVVAFLGDSYTEGTGASDPAHRWSTLLSEDQGWVEKNFGFGGTGYAVHGPVEGGQPYTARVPDVVATQPDIVVVSGGRNDVSEGADASDEVAETFTALRAGLPDAEIIAVNPMWDSDPAPDELVDLAGEVRAAVESVGGRYVDAGQPLAGQPGLVADDGVHPNDEGHAAIAEAVAAALG